MDVVIMVDDIPIVQGYDCADLQDSDVVRNETNQKIILK